LPARPGGRHNIGRPSTGLAPWNGGVARRPLRGAFAAGEGASLHGLLPRVPRAPRVAASDRGRILALLRSPRLSRPRPRRSDLGGRQPPERPGTHTHRSATHGQRLSARGDIRELSRWHDAVQPVSFYGRPRTAWTDSRGAGLARDGT